MADSVEIMWEIIHDYRRAVARDLAQPYRCDRDNQELLPQVGADDEPVLKCLYCRTVYHIGLDQWDEMKRKI